MGHGSEVYISNLVMKLRGNGRFWGLDKKKRGAGCALRASAQTTASAKAPVVA